MTRRRGQALKRLRLAVYAAALVLLGAALVVFVLGGDCSGDWKDSTVPFRCNAGGDLAVWLILAASWTALAAVAVLLLHVATLLVRPRSRPRRVGDAATTTSSRQSTGCPLKRSIRAREAGAARSPTEASPRFSSGASPETPEGNLPERDAAVRLDDALDVELAGRVGAGCDLTLTTRPTEVGRVVPLGLVSRQA